MSLLQLPEHGRRIRTAVRTLVRRFSVSERTDLACCGMTVAQAATLEALHCCGPTRLSDLSRRLGIAPSTMTRNLRRLETEGKVEKVADPADARATLVRLTEAGEGAADAVQQQEIEFSMDVLRRLPEEQRKTVAESLEILLEAVREATRDCCGGAFDHLMEERGEACETRGRPKRAESGCCS